VLVCHDISEIHEMSQRMTYLATHDSLTGLLNRSEFENLLRSSLDRARKESYRSALCYLDLDHFKVVNDTCGHAAGDELLKRVSELLQASLRDHDALARLGGDEFGVVLGDCNTDDAYLTVQRLCRAIQDYGFEWEGSLFQITASAGLVAIAPGATDVGELMRMVDCACYVAKDTGRNRVHHYRPNDTEVVNHHGQMYWVQRIQEALRTERLSLYCQPTRCLMGDGKRTEYHELLLRIMDGDGRAIPAARFIPTAERYRLIIALDRWVVHTAFESIAQHPSKEPIIYGINLSGQSLSEDGFLSYVLEELRRYSIPPGRVCFEITESAAVTSFPRALGFVAALRRAGCRFALDDFGSGMSSFGYLKNLEIDYLKIDGGFVRSMIRDTYSYSLVQAINDIGHTLGVMTIAEFVESEDIIAKLIELGVDYAQGYAVARPSPTDVAECITDVPS
jgi:diguanylate cyclase (GGDEF)-like protein